MAIHTLLFSSHLKTDCDARLFLLNWEKKKKQFVHENTHTHKMSEKTTEILFITENECDAELRWIDSQHKSALVYCLLQFLSVSWCFWHPNQKKKEIKHENERHNPSEREIEAESLCSFCIDTHNIMLCRLIYSIF